MSEALADGWSLRPGGGRALAEGGVDVFRVPLAADAATVRAREAVLDAAELARAGRRPTAAKRAAFVLARAALRRVLAECLGETPQSIEFSIGQHGKPALAGAAGAGLQFNLSHSHELALIAVARDVELGVDIEYMREIADMPRLARRSFSEHEVAVLEALPPAQRHAAFFRCWSRKEAVIKANGRGISLGLGAFDVTLAPDEAPRLLATRWAPDEAADWQLYALDPHPDYAAALAAGAAGLAIRTWSIEP